MVVNSHVANYENTDTYFTYDEYDTRNLNLIHEIAPTFYNQDKSNSVPSIDLAEEDFTGDSLSFLVKANNLHE